MKIHKEGNKIIAFFFVLIAAILVVVTLVFPDPPIIRYILYIAGAGFWLFIISFFRFPSRYLKIDDNCIYAPADGKIVVIQNVIEDEYFKEERLQVSIFMSALNVHVNWYPISGVVKYFKYHAGSYIIAKHPKSSVKNERTSLVIESKENKTILVRQIAGMVARRIVFYSTEGEDVTQGEQLGFIKFGSRVDLFLPTDTKLNISLNQKVTGLTTVLGTFS